MRFCAQSPENACSRCRLFVFRAPCSHFSPWCSASMMHSVQLGIGHVVAAQAELHTWGALSQVLVDGSQTRGHRSQVAPKIFTAFAKVLHMSRVFVKSKFEPFSTLGLVKHKQGTTGAILETVERGPTLAAERCTNPQEKKRRGGRTKRQSSRALLIA